MSIYNDLPLTLAEQEAEAELEMHLPEERRQFKQKTLQQLLAYRSSYGMGALQALERASGVSEYILRDMLAATPVAYSYWTKVSKGLSKLFGANK